DLAEALALEPDHLSAYELEAKSGTRFTHRHGTELRRQAEAMESYFEVVVERLTEAGYRWYETASFARAPELVGGRDLRARHTRGSGPGPDSLGPGGGASSTIEGRRWRTAPSLARYLEALARSDAPPREVEELPPAVRAAEQVLLGLRLDEPLVLAEVTGALDHDELDRLEREGLVASARGQLRPTRPGPVL